MSWRVTTIRIIAAAVLVPLVVLAIAVSLSAMPSRADPALDTEEAAFLTQINAYRAANCATCAPLAIETHLNNSADYLSTDMAAKDYLDHMDSMGRDPQTREIAYGFNGTAWGENILCGSTTAQEAMTQWEGDEPHRLNMLSDVYNVIGIARVDAPATTCGIGGQQQPFEAYFWTTDFGCTALTNTPCPALTTTASPSPTASVTAAPTPSPTPIVTASPTPTTTPAVTPTTSATPTSSPSPTVQPCPSPRYKGDADGNGLVDINDVLATLSLLAGVPSGATCAALAEVDCDGELADDDALRILDFVAGAPLAQPTNCPGVGTLT